MDYDITAAKGTAIYYNTRFLLTRVFVVTAVKRTIKYQYYIAAAGIYTALFACGIIIYNNKT